jgi:hypothetical protein
MKRQIRMASMLLAAAVALSPARGSAQSSPDGPTLKMGPFELRPRLRLSNIGVDYNVFNEDANPKRDFTFTAAPDLEVSVHPGRLRLAYTSGSELVYFHKYVSERSVNRTLAARADLDLTILKPFVAMSSAHTTARPNSEIDVRVRHHPRTYTAGATLRLASRTSMTFTGRRAIESYDDGFQFRGVELSRSLDNTTNVYEGAVNLELTPFTTVSLVTAQERQRFDRSPVRNSDSLRITPTVVFNPLGQITGTASIGYRRFDGHDAALADFSGLVSSGTIGLLLGDKYKLETSFTRDVRYSYEEGLPYYVVTGGRGTLAMQTVAALDLRATAGRESMDYRALVGGASPGIDRVTLYGGGFGYRIAERIRIVVEVEFWRRASDRDQAREYRNRRIVTSLNWGALNR